MILHLFSHWTKTSKRFLTSVKTANAKFDTAKNWLQVQGMQAIDGPTTAKILYRLELIVIPILFPERSL